MEVEEVKLQGEEEWEEALEFFAKMEDTWEVVEDVNLLGKEVWEEALVLFAKIEDILEEVEEVNLSPLEIFEVRQEVLDFPVEMEDIWEEV